MSKKPPQPPPARPEPSKGSVTFGGTIEGLKLEITMDLTVHGQPEPGTMSLEMARELLVRVAITITNPGALDELGSALAYEEPGITKMRPVKLKRVK